MKKFIALVLTGLLLSVCALAKDNLSPSTVTVLPAKVPSDNPQIKLIASTVTDTVSLTIKLLGKYKFVRIPLSEKQKNNYSLKELKSLSERYNIDNIIFGSISESKNNIVFNFSVYNKAKGKVVLKKEATTESIFDIFNISDNLTIELIEGFSNVHIAFGNVTLKNEGEKGSYSVFIDGQFIGKNVEEINHIFYGKHVLTIKQKRLNSEKIIFEQNIEIPENSTIIVHFKIPYLTKKEQKIFTEIDRKLINTMETNGEYSEIIHICNTALNTLDTMHNLPAYKNLEEKYSNIHNFYTTQYLKQQHEIPPAEIKIDGNSKDWKNIPTNIDILFNSPFESIKFSHDPYKKNKLFILIKMKQKATIPNDNFLLDFDTNLNGDFTDHEDRSLQVYYADGWRIDLMDGIGRQDIKKINAPRKIKKSYDSFEIYLDMEKAKINRKFNFHVETYNQKRKRYEPRCKTTRLYLVAKNNDIEERKQNVTLASQIPYLYKNLYESDIETEKLVLIDLLNRERNSIDIQIKRGEIPSVEDNTMIIDGHNYDWLPVEPVIEDPTNDKSKPTSNADIYRVYIVHDSKNLFVRLQLADGSLANNYYGIRFSDKPHQYNGSKLFFLFPDEKKRYHVSLDRRVDNYSGKHAPIVQGKLAILPDGGEFSFPLRYFKKGEKTDIYITAWDDNGVSFDNTTQRHYILKFNKGF